MNLRTINIASQDDWVVGTEIDIFTDNGSGTLGTTPINGRRIRCWPHLLPSYGFGSAPFGQFVFGDVRPKGAFAEAPFGEDPFGQNAPRITVRVPVKAFDGAQIFGAKVYDQAGTPQITAVAGSSVIMNLAPVAAHGASLSIYDVIKDVLFASFSAHVE